MLRKTESATSGVTNVIKKEIMSIVDIMVREGITTIEEFIGKYPHLEAQAMLRKKEILEELKNSN